MERADVYTLIDAERTHQTTKLGEQDPSNTTGDFLVYLDEYLAQAKAAYTSNTDPLRGLDQIRKIAAIAVACIEKFGQ